MSKILQIIRMDQRHIAGNVIALVVCVGMVVVPSFYAWFNTAGFWDPYGNTANLRVALANSDEGYKSDLMPLEVNIGERTVSELRESKSISYEVTDEDEAREGVASGKYYAAIVIPQDFSRTMLTGLFEGGDGERPKVEYVSNQKRNAIANIVTQKASSSVSQTIDKTFVSTAVEVGASALDEIGDYLDDDHLATVVGNLDDALDDGVDDLRRTSDNLRGYASLADSVNALASSADGTLRGTLDSTNGVGSSLRQASSGVRQLDSGLGSATGSLDDAITQAGSSYDGLRQSIDKAFDDADGQAGTAAERLGELEGIVNKRYSDLDDLYRSLDGDTATLADHEQSYQDARKVAGATVLADLQYAHQAYVTVSGLNRFVRSARDNAKALDDTLKQAIEDLSGGRTDAQTARAQLEGLVDDAKASVTSVKADYEGSLGTSLRDLADGIDGAADTADSLLSQLGDASDDLSGTVSDASTSLTDLRDALNAAADKLSSAADDLDGTRARLADALQAGDLTQVRQILSADPTSLAGFISEPIQLNRNAVFPVANNGSAMSPFYSTLSIWIGAVILCALVKTAPSEEALRRIGAKPRHAYFGRIFFFVLIGLMQTLVIVGGNLFFLEIQCLHPWLYLLCSLVASVVFVNLVFSLTASFGDVGKAIAVLLMVLQVAGSGGTFPMEMLPKAFQAVYPFLPFVHAENCMRAAIAGLYGLDFWVSLAKLAAFLVPSLVLGLLLRKPVIRLNHWFERQLERTKIM